MPKKILILFGSLFLTILLFNIVSALNMCSFQLNSADCMGTSGGQVVMDLSGTTNAHGALAGQGAFAGVLCCNFGTGDTTCSSELDPDTNQPINKIIGLSSSTNAHAEIPDLVSPNYNIDGCYNGLKNCGSIDAGSNCAIDEIEVLYLSSGAAQLYTNAHIEEAGLSPQNYNSEICCVIDYVALCELTTVEWQYEEVFVGTDTGAIVNGTLWHPIK